MCRNDVMKRIKNIRGLSSSENWIHRNFKTLYLSGQNWIKAGEYPKIPSNASSFKELNQEKTINKYRTITLVVKILEKSKFHIHH